MMEETHSERDGDMRRKRARVIRAEYNADGYVVYADDTAIYSALNAVAGTPVLGAPVPVSVICQYALATVRHLAAKHGAAFGGVRRVQVLLAAEPTVS
jgi:hypothetical protein